MGTIGERKAFLAMPFRASYEGLLRVIRDVAHDLGLNLVKIDECPMHGSIVDQVRNEINEADLMIAIVTEENGNVYYEIGLAHCRNKPVVLLTADPSSLKFDLRDHRAIVYDQNRPEAIFHNLTQALRVAIDPQYTYPHDYFLSVYGTMSHDVKEATEKGIQRAVESVSQLAKLRQPVELSQLEVLRETGEVTLEVRDFFGKRVRAVLDRNGFISEWHRMR